MKIIKIGLSCSPSKIINSEKIKTTVLLITYGGGMGGTHETLYCTKVDQTKADFLKCTLLSGEVQEIYPRYIVKRCKRDVVKIVTNITEHVNYNKSTKICNKAIETEFIELKFGEDYKIVDKYTARHEGELAGRTIHKSIETE